MKKNKIEEKDELIQIEVLEGTPTLEELLEGVKDDKSNCHEESDTGPLVGKEVW